jgi:hypothetical protein
MAAHFSKAAMRGGVEGDGGMTPVVLVSVACGFCAGESDRARLCSSPASMRPTVPFGVHSPAYLHCVPKGCAVQGGAQACG